MDTSFTDYEPTSSPAVSMISGMSPLMLGVIVVVIAVVLYFAWQYMFSSDTRKQQDSEQMRMHGQVHRLSQEIERLRQDNAMLEEQLRNLAFHVQEDQKNAQKLDEKLAPVLQKYNEFFSKYNLEETEVENTQDTRSGSAAASE